MGMERRPAQRRVTMKEVALEAGVSQSTVSFVLNGQEDMRISDETRRRVMAAIEKLGYRPRGAGRPPRRAGLRVIGVMFDQIATSQFAAISVEGIQDEAWQNGVLAEVVMTGGDPEYEAAVLRKWRQDGVDGVIYGSILTRLATPPPALAQHRAILLNCHDVNESFASVVPAERRGSEAATRALIEAGHERIAFISGERWMEASEQRLEGYSRALRNAGRDLDPAYVREGNFLPSGGRSATLDLMSGPVRPDAIYCANDLMALGCYEALKELGERVGETVAVMGYDDQELAQHLSPQLSTVLLPHREMGQVCVRRLLTADPDDTAQVRLECPLVTRASHLKIPPSA